MTEERIATSLSDLPVLGLDPVMTKRGLLADFVVKVAPVRVAALNQCDFPAPRPVLDVLLTLYRRHNRLVNLEIDKPMNAVPRRETRQPVSVFEHALNQITGNANIEGSVGAAGEDVDVCAEHGFAIA